MPLRDERRIRRTMARKRARGERISNPQAYLYGTLNRIRRLRALKRRRQQKQTEHRRKKSMRPGGGGRFARLVARLKQRKDVRDPRRLAAWIGRQKYGPRRMAYWAAAARRRAA